LGKLLKINKFKTILALIFTKFLNKQKIYPIMMFVNSFKEIEIDSAMINNEKIANFWAQK